MLLSQPNPGAWHLTVLAVGVFLAAAVTVSLRPVGDVERGKALHDSLCISCHAERVGGDGSKIYQRRHRLIHDVRALRDHIAMCAGQTGAGWLAGDKDDVTAYLVRQHYYFH